MSWDNVLPNYIQYNKWQSFVIGSYTAVDTEPINRSKGPKWEFSMTSERASELARAHLNLSIGELYKLLALTHATDKHLFTTYLYKFALASNEYCSPTLLNLPLQRQSSVFLEWYAVVPACPCLGTFSEFKYCTKVRFILWLWAIISAIVHFDDVQESLNIVYIKCRSLSQVAEFRFFLNVIFREQALEI